MQPLAPAAARALPEDRKEAARIIDSTLDPGWPRRDLLDVLPNQAAASPEDARFGIWVIILRDSQTVIGDAGFHGPPRNGTVEIGYSIVRAYRRRGYATEAAQALIAWVLSQENVNTVVARCDEDNEASIGTLERLGLSRVGQATGQLHWRL